MDPSYVLNLLLLAGLVGFGLFCLSYAVHMWRRRHAGSGSARPAGLPGHLVVWGRRVAGLGVLLLVCSLLQRELTGRAGLLSGDGLFTVRAHSSRKLQHLTSESRVARGDTVARFYAPQDQARSRVLALRLKVLEARRQALQHSALELDAEVVRGHATATADRRQWRAQLASLIPARCVARREQTFARLDREVQLCALDVELQRLRGELAGARVQIAFHQDRQALIDKGGANRVATTLERREASNEVRKLEAQIGRLEQQLASIARQRGQVTENLAAIAALAKDEQADLAAQIEKARAGLGVAETRLPELEEALGVDRARAQRLREREMAQIRLEARQVEAELKGLHDTLEVAAPFAGEVVYCERAPNLAYPEEPVLVLAPARGLRVRLRLPAREVGPLSRAGTVVLELAEPRLQRRLPGRVLSSHPLPHEPSYRLVEMACDPAAETIRLLASEEEEPVEARLLWRPPLWSLPLAPWAVVLAVLGLSAWPSGLVWARRRAAQQAHGADAEDTPAAQPAAARAPMSQVGPTRSQDAAYATIRMLGGHLAAELADGRVESDSLSAVEWALARHHTRAVRVLREVLEEHPEAMARLSDCAEQSGGCGDNGDGLHARAQLQRIARAVLSSSAEHAADSGTRSLND